MEKGQTFDISRTHSVQWFSATVSLLPCAVIHSRCRVRSLTPPEKQPHSTQVSPEASASYHVGFWRSRIWKQTEHLILSDTQVQGSRKFSGSHTALWQSPLLLRWQRGSKVTPPDIDQVKYQEQEKTPNYFYAFFCKKEHLKLLGKQKQNVFYYYRYHLNQMLVYIYWFIMKEMYKIFW